MAEEGVYMDVEATIKMADRFRDFSDILKNVSKALEAAMTTLQVTAFVGMVGGAALQRYIAFLKPNVDNMANKCAELHLDIMGAVVSYRDGDVSGSKRFQ